jgi:hypothetical protein
MADMLVPFRWETLTQELLPPWRAFLLNEDLKPLSQLITQALSQLPVKVEAQVRAALSHKKSLRKWFAFYSLATACQPETTDLGSFLAHLVSPQGRRDAWGEEYSVRLLQLLRGHRVDLSKRFANSTWPQSLEGRPSPAADSQLDELFAECLLFFAAPYYEGAGDFSKDPQGGKHSAIYLEREGKLVHVRIAASEDGFSSLRQMQPALFTGYRRFPFSQERHEETETCGPLYPAEVKQLGAKLSQQSNIPAVASRVIQEAAEQDLGLFLWKCGF